MNAQALSTSAATRGEPDPTQSGPLGELNSSADRATDLSDRVAPEAWDWFAEQQKFWRRMLNAPDLMQLAYETQVGTTPFDLVFEKHPFRLLRYRRSTEASYAEPVLFCYALVNRPYILDLKPDKSVVRHYLERGFEVYMIDWGVPSYADQHLTLDDYVCKFLVEVVQFILDQTARKSLHLLGYCMGGTMSALFTALEPQWVRTLTLLAAPIDFGGRASLLNCWTDRNYFDVDAFVDTHGNCPAWFLQSCFLLMRPVQNFLEKYISFYERMDDLQAIATFFAMERWVNDNVPVAGGVFRGFVKSLYQADELVRGKFLIGGRPAELRRISCPLLLLTAKNDHLVPPSSTEGIRPHVKSEDITSMMVDGGHVGLVTGGEAQKTLWPEATRWLADRSTAPERRHWRASQQAKDFTTAEFGVAAL